MDLVAQGKTEKEAMENMKDLIDECLSDPDIPKPKLAVWEFDYQGKLIEFASEEELANHIKSRPNEKRVAAVIVDGTLMYRGEKPAYKDLDLLIPAIRNEMRPGTERVFVVVVPKSFIGYMFRKPYILSKDKLAKYAARFREKRRRESVNAKRKRKDRAYPKPGEATYS